MNAVSDSRKSRGIFVGVGLVFIALALAVAAVGNAGVQAAGQGQGTSSQGNAPAAVTCPGTPAQCFADVVPGSTFFNYANHVYEQGVVSGYACGGPGEACDGSNRPYYRPGAGVTRGQMSKFTDNARTQPGIVVSDTTGVVPADMESSSTIGLRALSKAANYGGVYATGAGPGGYGVYGEATANLGRGVIGVGTSTNTVGVDGAATGPTGSQIGVRGTSVNGYGVAGYASGSGYGVYATSATLIAVRAEADAANYGGVYATGRGAGGYGMYGEGTGAGGFGVVGVGTGNNTIGVEGRSTGTGLTKIGVRGTSADGFGVAGYSTNGYGVYGLSTGNYSGYFFGNVRITGTCCLASENVSQIDDPLDPANKYLNQALIESPDLKSIIDGNTTTDATGEAVVALPAYFQAGTSDYRYQLTVVGQFAQAIVSSELKDSHFTIKTDKPNVKVSWQVTGIRQDPYAKAHPVQAEQAKPAAERGKYLHPQEQGQPESVGIGYDERLKLQQVAPLPKGQDR